MMEQERHHVVSCTRGLRMVTKALLRSDIVLALVAWASSFNDYPRSHFATTGFALCEARTQTPAIRKGEPSQVSSPWFCSCPSSLFCCLDGSMHPQHPVGNSYDQGCVGPRFGFLSSH